MYKSEELAFDTIEICLRDLYRENFQIILDTTKHDDPMQSMKAFDDHIRSYLTSLVEDIADDSFADNVEGYRS